MAIIHREDYILHEGDTVTCPGGVVYTISGEPIGFGGSAVVYPAVRNDTELEYALKECFPGDRFVRRDGVVCPEDPGDPAAFGLLEKYRANLKTEQLIGQRVRNTTVRAVSIYETLTVEAITTGGKTHTDVSGAIFSVLERMDRKARSFDDVLEEIKAGYNREERRRTKGLPKIHTTACLMEEVLTVLQAVHENDVYYGDLHNGNVCFTESCPEEGRVGIAHLLDFGSSRVLDSRGETEELTGGEVFSTRGFRPPEMLETGIFRLTKKADIYSAGCLMLRCVATAAKLRPLGESPAIHPDFLDETDGGRIGCSGSVLKRINEILEKALAERPEDRYSDVPAMLEDIRRLKTETEPPGFRLPENLSAPDYFVPGSRDREIRTMTEALQRGETVFIWGVGGIGKTETAIALARKARPQKGAYLIHYRGTMRETILSLEFEGYVPPAGGRSPEADEAADYAARIGILKKHYAGALFVIDNFDAPGKSLDELRAERACVELVALGNPLVFTTRCPVQWQPEHRLQPLSGTDQLSLMRRFCPGSAVADRELQELSDEVGGHTLAISLIAKTLHAAAGRISAETMLRALRHSRLSREQMPAVVSDRNRTYGEAELYSQLKALFDLSGLEEPARAVMDCCAFLPAGGMDLRLFTGSLEPEQADACRALVQQGWLSLSGEHMLQIHPLVRELVREKFRPDSAGFRSFLGRIFRLAEPVPQTDSVCWRSKGMIRWADGATAGHAAQAAHWACEAIGFLEQPPAELLWFAAALLEDMKRRVRSRHYAEAARACPEEGLTLRDRAGRLYVIAVYESRIGWPRCLETGERVCALWEQVLAGGLEDGERSEVLRAYAKTCELLCRISFMMFFYAGNRQEFRYDAAVAYGRKALELADLCGLPDPFFRSRIHQMLAGTYGRMIDLGRDLLDGLFVGIKAHLRARREAAALRERRMYHLEQARSEAMAMEPVNPGWLAALQEATGDTLDKKEAEARYRAALELLQGIGVSNRDCRTGLNLNIAELYKKLGDYRKALGYTLKPGNERSGKWYIRFLLWFLLRFSRSTRNNLFRHRLMDAMGQMLVIGLFPPLSIPFIASLVMVLRDSLADVIRYLAEGREDRQALDRSGK